MLSESQNSSLKNSQITMVVDECESIICTDVIFAVINESFMRIQHIVYGFDNEARILYNEVSKRGLEDRIETSSRAFQAKEDTFCML